MPVPWMLWDRFHGDFCGFRREKVLDPPLAASVLAAQSLIGTADGWV